MLQVLTVDMPGDGGYVITGGGPAGVSMSLDGDRATFRADEPFTLDWNGVTYSSKDDE